ncbi:hypothetical protein ACTM50_25680, partial [Citrobacter freundii]|uniref:hypothetical protein n=1 Tax=Citrobacter freundii TaxID=546 RepID=UPI00333949CB
LNIAPHLYLFHVDLSWCAAPLDLLSPEYFGLIDPKIAIIKPHALAGQHLNLSEDRLNLTPL